MDLRKKVVVIGNGMVGQKFMEKVREFDVNNDFKLTTFCEEPRAAYNRMRLTEYFTNRDLDNLSLVGEYQEDGKGTWFEENGVDVYLGDKAVELDTSKKVIRSALGREEPYDVAVLATGSSPFVPPVAGKDKAGVFVYRTIEDLEAMISYQKEHGVTKAAVIGGGLLGLEAAKAMYDLGMETHILEYAPMLMGRQIDAGAYGILKTKIEEMGLKIHTDARVAEFTGEGAVDGVAFSEESGWDKLDVGMVVISAGIRPRDEIAKGAVDCHERGGILVDAEMKTSDESVLAIGECAVAGGFIYGLVAPCYQQAEAAAYNLVNNPPAEERKRFEVDFLTAMSTKLKLLGCEVASFGDYMEKDDTVSLVANDPFAQKYKKLVFTKDGQRLKGGILVGDASDFNQLLNLVTSDKPLAVPPSELMFGAADGGGAAGGVEDMDDGFQVCSCNNVNKGQIMAAISEQGLTTVAETKACTKAGTGCGGCMPDVEKLFKAAMEKAGVELDTSLCEHFAYSRQELYDIVRATGTRTFKDLLASHGRGGHGCETCKPAVASILASTWNEVVTLPEHLTLLDTNDRSLGNMQRGGTYSVVPRVPGGEIMPEQLIAMGEVAQQYGLYTKITGGQRVDLFGAYKHQLPEIWDRLTAVGLESGHAYAKSLRTVKSCVGSTWCRYGQQDSVGFAIRVENRYKGFRSPHKLKGAVSGCTRECAEAQCKDFGLIATEAGYDLYVCGNGGVKPRHGDLLATSIDEDTAIQYLDRFLMYYAKTADKLERTAPWLERLPGGIDYLKKVVIDDHLQINADLEAQMQHVVDTYQNEWATAAADPAMRKRFRQFVNTDRNQELIQNIPQRGQQRPADWPKAIEWVPMKPEIIHAEAQWERVGTVDDFPEEGGAAVLWGETQLAVFNFASRGEWYCTQNVCPHMRAPVLSEGIIGTAGEAPKVACPLHKKTFDLRTGAGLDDPSLSLSHFPVKVEGGEVFAKLPPPAVLDEYLATQKLIIKADTAHQCSGACDDKEEKITAAEAA